MTDATVMFASGMMVGGFLGLGFGLWLAARGAKDHVQRVDRLANRMESTATRAERISLHVSDQYAPLKERLERVEVEIEDLRQRVHQLITEIPDTDPENGSR